MRVAVKIAYPGEPFHGFARQPDARTVEGEVRFALRAAGICPDPTAARLRAASRTDRGVSAIGNVIAFDTAFPVRGIVPAFNRRAQDVFAWAAASVPDGFNPTAATERWYRYTVYGETDRKRLRTAFTWIVGRHDFRRFVTHGARPPEEIRAIDLSELPDGVAIDVRARAFAWNVVRRIVDAGRAYAAGEVSDDDLRSALRGEGRYRPGLADPRFLVLVEVDHGLSYPYLADGGTREAIRKHVEASAARHSLLLALRAAATGGVDAVRGAFASGPNET